MPSTAGAGDTAGCGCAVQLWEENGAVVPGAVVGEVLSYERLTVLKLLTQRATHPLHDELAVGPGMKVTGVLFQGTVGKEEWGVWRLLGELCLQNGEHSVQSLF